MLKPGLTDGRLTALLAEHDRIGERVAEIDVRLAADEEAREEAARGVADGSGNLVTLLEVAERNALLELAKGLSAEDVRRAREERDLALERRRQIVLEIGDGLPEDEWVASGDWVLRVSREYGDGPRLLRRALAVAAGRQAEEGATPDEIVSLSADLERPAHPWISQTRRLLCSYPRVRKSLQWVCAGALLASLAVSLVTYARFAAEGSSGLYGMACFIATLCSLPCMLAWFGIEEAVSVHRSPLQPEESGTVRLGCLTAAYRLPKRAPEQAGRDEEREEGPTRAEPRTRFDRTVRGISGATDNGKNER